MIAATLSDRYEGKSRRPPTGCGGCTVILRAMQGDTAVASALFQQYVAGELPEKLLALSRRCVQEDQKGPPIREINGAPPRKADVKFAERGID
jgi:hypothetical protein